MSGILMVLGICVLLDNHIFTGVALIIYGAFFA